MKVDKWRFFNNTVTNKYIAEKITWALAGTDIINLNDPRAVSIGELRNHPVTGNPGFDLWVPLNMINCCGQGAGDFHTYQVENKTQQDENMVMVQVPTKISVISYSPMDVYNLPLMANLVEITMAEYNAGIIA